MTCSGDVVHASNGAAQPVFLEFDVTRMFEQEEHRSKNSISAAIPSLCTESLEMRDSWGMEKYGPSVNL